MIRFNLIVLFCVLGVLSPVMRAGDNVTPVKSIKLSAQQQKTVFRKLLHLVTKSVASVAKAPLLGSKVTKLKSIPIGHTALGIAEIFEYDMGGICSGVVFKPWIILTTAECLHGLNPERLYVAMLVQNSRNRNAFKKVHVQADSFHIHKKYKKGYPEHNVAMLLVYGDYDWKVGEFHLSRRPLTLDAVKKFHLRLFTDIWSSVDRYEDAYATVIPVNISESLKPCEWNDPSENWLCVVGKGSRDKYNKVDIGSPLYYYTKRLKRCGAIYTGKHLDKALKGQMYYSIHPSAEWIEEFIVSHSIPPVFA